MSKEKSSLKKTAQHHQWQEAREKYIKLGLPDSLVRILLNKCDFQIGLKSGTKFRGIQCQLNEEWLTVFKVDAIAESHDVEIRLSEIEWISTGLYL